MRKGRLAHRSIRQLVSWSRFSQLATSPAAVTCFRSVRLFVNNMERVMPTYNTLGFIRGSVEPDRYVILGETLQRAACVVGCLSCVVQLLTSLFGPTLYIHPTSFLRLILYKSVRSFFVERTFHF